ncbi:MAG: thioredoxin fold domain-containing protein [Gammaproteobacteria bacterium]|nr:thioredoxin fold domain-containing protein [Gammaproteobacteria bacterium]
MPGLTLTRTCAAIILLIGLSNGVLQAAPPEGYSFLPLTDAARQAGDEKKPMLLYFGRYGCSTCRKMHAEVFSDAAVSKKYNADFVLAYVDTESGNRIRLANGETTTEMQFAARSRILGTPTFIFFSPEQKPLFKKAGFQSIEQMTRYGDFIAKGHYRTMSLQDYLGNL